MGLEMERADMSVSMHAEELDTSADPFLSNKARVPSAEPSRDPNRMNAHLQVGFDDVIAEPTSAHSFDKVWIGSHAGFELIKYALYRALSLLLAVPAAFVLGLMFGVLSCIHIWLVSPAIRGILMLLPSVRIVWRSVTNTFITPLCLSAGTSLSSVHVKATED